MKNGTCLALIPALLAGACSTAPGPGKPGATPQAGTILCPAPIGPIAWEDCGEVALEFSALTISPSEKIAGSGRDGRLRIDAIRAASALADTIKDQRVKLCTAVAQCQVSVAEHDARDRVLGESMRALIDAWTHRHLSQADEIRRFREAVRVLDERLKGGPSVALPVSRASDPHTVLPEVALTKVADPALAFRVEAGAVHATATADGPRDVFRSNRDVLPLKGGHRYRITVHGRYVPATRPLVLAGDELLIRLKYRTTKEADLSIALRSFEDPDTNLAVDTWHAGAKAAGTHEAKFSANAQQSGFYVTLAVRGAPVELDDFEVTRQGTVLTAARGEGADGPSVGTDCALSKVKPIAGSHSFLCQAGDGDRMTLGKPAAYVGLVVRDAAGERGSVKSVSLDGGRGVDATMTTDGDLAVVLGGPGAVAIDRIEIADLTAN